jgi:ornithine cyclodeaminase
MHDGDLLILKDSEVRTLLAGREAEIIKCVQSAYEAHAKGESAFPHSSFLRFPNVNNRIIALPAYLGGEYELAGIKWVASFPANLELGFNRATAVIILNSAKTGRPNAMLEGSAISAKRTAGSAALAAQWLCKKEVDRVGIIGAGVINFEIINFLMATRPGIKSFVVYDRDPQRSQRLREQCQGIDVDVAPDINTVLKSCSLISLATTALEPHIFDLSECAPGTVVLHISLRDLSPEVILHCDNVADDIDSVCRAQTSVHLAEQYVGNRDFIRCALSEILLGMKPVRNGHEVTIFSPFGMGILDLALAKLTCDLALQEGRGSIVDSFC